MSLNGRARVCRVPDVKAARFDERNQDGTSAAGTALAPVNQVAPTALVTTFDRPEIVTRIEVGDPDAFDDPGCLVYQAGDA